MSCNNPNTFALKHPHYYFWLFIIIHTVLWTIGPAVLRPAMPHDTLEGITWGLQWQWGYSKHPFLTAWLCAGVTQLLGVVGWPVYLLAQGAVALTFIAVWYLAQQILPKTHALIAALLLEGVFFYNINSFNLTPDTLQSPLWALLALCFYQALTKQSVLYWIFTAVMAALCFCTKYQIAVLLLSMVLLMVFNGVARKSFTKIGMYVALLVFFMLISPHLVWLYHHHFITLTYAQEVAGDYTPNSSFLNHFTYPLAFIINNIIAVMGVLILLWPFYFCEKIPLHLSKLQWQFLLFMGLGPLLISIILCALSGDYFAPRWSTPYFFLIGILLIALLKPALSRQRLQRFAISLVLLSLVLFTGRMLTFTYYPRIYSDGFLPNQNIALSLETLWHSQYNKPLSFIAGSNYLVTGVLPYLQDKPRPYLNWDLSQSPWLNEDDLRNNGGLFIWDEGQNYTWDKNSRQNAHLTKEVMQRFPNLKAQTIYTFYSLADHHPIMIGVAILPPN